MALKAAHSGGELCCGDITFSVDGQGAVSPLSHVRPECPYSPDE